MRQSQLWGLADAFHTHYCLCQEVLSWFSFYLLTFTSHKRKLKKKNMKWSFFNNDVTGLLEKEPWEKSSLTGESEAASFLWVCDANKEGVFKRWLKFKSVAPRNLLSCTSASNPLIFPSLLFLVAQNVHQHGNYAEKNRSALKQKTGRNMCGWNQKIDLQHMTDCLQTAGS